jgi:hypothetical protein
MDSYEHLAQFSPWMDCVAIQKDVVAAEELLLRLAEMRSEARERAAEVETKAYVQ